MHGRIKYSPALDISKSVSGIVEDVGKTRDGRTSVTVKMDKTRDRTVRDMREFKKPRRLGLRQRDKAIIIYRFSQA